MFRKVLFSLLGCLLIANTVYAAGTCVKDSANSFDQSNVKVLKYTCTADASDGTYPAITLDAKGWKLTSVETAPGSPAPTDASDLVMTMNGVDILGGKGTDIIDNTSSLRTAPYNASLSIYETPVITALISAQVTQAATATNSAVTKLIFTFIK